MFSTVFFSADSNWFFLNLSQQTCYHLIAIGCTTLFYWLTAKSVRSWLGTVSPDHMVTPKTGLLRYIRISIVFVHLEKNSIHRRWIDPFLTPSKKWSKIVWGNFETATAPLKPFNSFSHKRKRKAVSFISFSL